MKIETIYTPTIMDGPVIRFQFGWDCGTSREIVSGRERTKWSCQITASSKGVSLHGDAPIYDDKAAIEAIQKLFGAAWDAYTQMRGNPNAHEFAQKFVDKFNIGEVLEAAE